MAGNPFDLSSTKSPQANNSAGVFNVAANNQPAGQPAVNFTSVTPSVGSTVAGQLQEILDADSPYLKTARARSQRQANSRGLINSSIAAGAGEEAAINAALPIAQQDASTFFTAQRANQDASNSFGMANLNFTNNKTLQDDQQQFVAGESGLDRDQALRLQGNQLGFQSTQAGLDRTQQKDILTQQQTFQGQQAGLERGQQLTLQGNELALNREQLAQQVQQAELERIQQKQLQGEQLSSQERLLLQQQAFQGGQAELERQQQAGLVQKELDATANRQTQQLQSTERLAQAENNIRQTILNTQIQSEKDLSTLRAALDREAQVFNSQLQDEKSLLDITRGRNASLQQLQLQLGGNFMNTANALLANPEIDAESKMAAVAKMREEFDSLIALAESLQSDAVLTAGQGGV